MTHSTHTPTINETNQFRASLDSFFAGVGQGFNAYLMRRSRMDQIDFLNAKTDAELAELGLQRDDIVRHVFRDLLHM